MISVRHNNSSTHSTIVYTVHCTVYSAHECSGIVTNNLLDACILIKKNNVDLNPSQLFT